MISKEFKRKTPTQKLKQTTLQFLQEILKFTFHSDFSDHSLRTDLFALRLFYSPVETEFQGATRGALHKRPLFTYARSYLTSRGRESASNWRIGNFASQRAFVFYVTIFAIEVVEIQYESDIFTYWKVKQFASKYDVSQKCFAENRMKNEFCYFTQNYTKSKFPLPVRDFVTISKLQRFFLSVFDVLYRRWCCKTLM